MSVTLPELKSHLRITWDDEDATLGIYLASAIEYVGGQIGRHLSRRQRVSNFDCFGDLELIGENPEEISVEYVDVHGNQQTLPDSAYDLKNHKARPYLTLAYNQSWPSYRQQDAAISVTYTSGYDEATLPESLKGAVLIEAATQYEFREDETVVKLHSRETVKRLYQPYRIYSL